MKTKRKILIAILILLMFGILSIPFFTKGDVDLDGTKDSNDFLMVYCYVIGEGNYHADKFTEWRMDTDSDGDIDLNDTVYYYDILEGDN